MTGIKNCNALEGLVQSGFTAAEATRIRPYLPRRFDPIQALPAINIHSWEAIRAVQDALQYNNFEFKFIYKWLNGDLLSHFVFNHREYIEYVSPTYQTRFLTIEFVRHFGDAIYTERSADPDAGRRLTFVNNGLRMKLRDMAKALSMLSTCSDPGVFPFEVAKPKLIATALRCGWEEWAVKEDGFGLNEFRNHCSPLDRVMWQTLCKQLDPSLMDFEKLVAPHNPVEEAFKSELFFRWTESICLPNGQRVGMSLPSTMTRLDEMATQATPPYPQVNYYLDGGVTTCVELCIPEHIYRAYPHEMWLGAW